MINIAILGLGRIGKIHVANIASDPKCNIECIYDIDNSISLEISKKGSFFARNSFIQRFIHSFIQSSIRTFVGSFMHSFTHS